MVIKQNLAIDNPFKPFPFVGLSFNGVFEEKHYPEKIENSRTWSCITEDQLEIDTDITKLSSRKLWQILRLCQVKQCQLDESFIQEVESELILRNDFDNGKAWAEPH